jgi:hypothetical protein
MTTVHDPLRELLLGELCTRQEHNASYSLRAFARDLGVNVTSLSEFFSNRRRLSSDTIRKVADKLCLSPFVLSSILQGTDGAARKSALPDPIQLEEDTFRVISEWYYYGILSLARVKGNRGEVGWISKRLGITVPEARNGLERLVRMGFIEVKNGRMRRTSLPITTSKAIPLSAIRKYHKQNLALAEKAIDEVPREKRFVTAITMPTDKKRYEKATEFILKFREELSAFLESGNPEDVYTLSIQLFPLTKPRGNA